MARSAARSSGNWLQISATVAITAALTLLMVFGIDRAAQLQSASAALEVVSELSSQPDLLLAELTLLQRGLEGRTWLGDSLRDIGAVRERSRHSFETLQADLQRAGLATSPALAATLAEARGSWTRLDQALAPLDRASGDDFYNDTVGASGLTRHGTAVKATVDAVLATDAGRLRGVASQLRDMSAQLRTTVADGGRTLRTLLLGGTAVAALLLALWLFHAIAGRRARSEAASAQRQVADILGTVREGLFLVGRDLRVGGTCSASLATLLRTPTPAGRSFEDLLRPLTDEKTLSAGLKFLSLLWRDKVNDELIESINPLGQIEVRFERADGGHDVRWLSFAFRRVRGTDPRDGHALCVVSDITDRVLLARELDGAKDDGESQTALVMQLLRIDPLQLDSWQLNAGEAFRKANALLTAPELGQRDLRRKLDGVFREIHAVKGEAAAIRLATAVQRAHGIEELLAALRTKETLTGNDFVPVVVRLDELMSHAAEIRTLQDRLAAFQARSAPAVQPAAVRTAGPGTQIAHLLDGLAAEVARARQSEVRLETSGLEQVPAAQAATIRDICVQMVRNAIVHGIETPAERLAGGKPAAGTVRVTYSEDGADGRALTIEDDGHGLDYEAIVDQALRQGLVRPAELAGLDRSTVYRLIFKPGFSTAGAVSEHAGRGVGLDAVNALARQLGGRIGLATAPGKYTRFRIQLPSIPEAAAARPA